MVEWTGPRSDCTASLFLLFTAIPKLLLFGVLNNRSRLLKLLLLVLSGSLYWLIIGRAALVDVISGLWYAKPGHFVGGQVEVPQDLVSLRDELVQKAVSLFFLEHFFLFASWELGVVTGALLVQRLRCH